MNTNREFTKPIIKFYSSDIPTNGTLTKNCYFTFSPNSKSLTSGNLLSYSFDRDIKSVSGSFNISVKEDILVTESNNFFDKMNLLDVVVIYEDGSGLKPVFYGIIENISIGATAESNQKSIQISGSSLDSLFEKLEVAIDATAMAIFQTATNSVADNKSLLTNILNQFVKKDGSQSNTIKNCFNIVYKNFADMVNNYPGISNGLLAQIIELWYGSDKFDINDSLTYNYPISQNLYQDATVNVMTYFENLMPKNVYEIFGYVNSDGEPKIMVRECPFSADNWKTPLLHNNFSDSGILSLTKISADVLTDYTFTLSGQEVYNVFMSYLLNSPVNPDYARKLDANEQGNTTIAVTSMDKIAKWGYRPMMCEFCGFHVAKTQQEQTENSNKTKDELKKNNAKLAEWYGKLDEMFNGSITTVVVKDYSYPKIGERVQIANGQFYVTKEHHSWNYGRSIQITYSCERGGKYDGEGNFSKLTGLSLARAEMRG